MNTERSIVGFRNVPLIIILRPGSSEDWGRLASHFIYDGEGIRVSPNYVRGR